MNGSTRPRAVHDSVSCPPEDRKASCERFRARWEPRGGKTTAASGAPFPASRVPFPLWTTGRLAVDGNPCIFRPRRAFSRGESVHGGLMSPVARAARSLPGKEGNLTWKKR